jgi:hypothetical protein
MGSIRLELPENFVFPTTSSKEIEDLKQNSSPPAVATLNLFNISSFLGSRI